MKDFNMKITDDQLINDVKNGKDIFLARKAKEKR